jgi:hypothetical protein
MRPSKASYAKRARTKAGWDNPAEYDLLRHFCRTSFWDFFLFAFGDGNSPKGQKWIDPEIHEPLARWFQHHVEDWMEGREAGRVEQKHLAVIVHREVGKSRMITSAGQLWLHLLDPELSSFTGSESLDLSRKILNVMRGVIDGSDPYAFFTRLYGNWSIDARQWARESITHAARTQTSRADPSMGTFAVETSIVGAHPDAIFYDDPISYERLTTDTNWIAAVISQLSSLVPVLQGDGLQVSVGTRYDPEDHFGQMIEKQGIASIAGMVPEGMEPSPDGNIHVYFLAGRDPSDRSEEFPEGRPTTPKVWPHTRMLRYQRTDPLRYASQVMNDPSISELNPITREQIAQCGIEKKEVPWSALRYAICCDTAFSDGAKVSTKDETVLIVHGYPRNGSGDVYVIEGYGNASLRAEDFGRMLVSMVQRYRRMGFRIMAITDEKTRAGKKDAWKLALNNFFADANEPMPRFIEFERGATRKYERLHSASTFWVDGHVRYVKGAPGVDRLCEQMARIGQYAVNPRLKIDWADAHSDAFQSEIYQPMRRVGNERSPLDRGASPISMDGIDQSMYEDDETRSYRSIMPREPIG